MLFSLNKILFEKLKYSIEKNIKFIHFGWGGKGIGGSLIYGIGFINNGFGGGSWAGFIPPRANGSSFTEGICFWTLSTTGIGGWL